MKRSPLKRRTPLQRSRLDAGGNLPRRDDGASKSGSQKAWPRTVEKAARPEGVSGRKPLARESKKRQAEQRLRRKVMLAAFGENPQCAIRWDDRCQGWADACHELRKASQGGSRVDPANCVPSCHPCNSAVEDYPVEAHRRGWVLWREDVA